MWNEKEVHRFNTVYNMWPWALTSLMTLTLDVSRSNFEIAVSQELLVWLMWNEEEVSWYDTGPTVWHCPLTTPMTLTLEFQGHSLKLLYLRNVAANWHGTKMMWVIISWRWCWLVWPWFGGRLYRIVNGVTSDVGVPSTYLVWFGFIHCLPSGNRSCCNENLMSVCLLKQNIRGTSHGFTNIESNWNMSRSDWNCSSVHTYRLNHSKWTFFTKIWEGGRIFPKVGD